MRKRQPLPKLSLRHVWALRHVWHLLRSFSKARKALSQHLLGTRKEKRRAIVARAQRPSSHVLPIPDAMDDLVGDVHDSLFYYDSTWSSAFPSAPDGGNEGDDAVTVPVSKLAVANVADVGNEIDQLADVFIAGFHEKFRLEKQESYRMFHEMLARGA